MVTVLTLSSTVLLAMVLLQGNLTVFLTIFFEFYNFIDKKKNLLGQNIERSNKNHKIIQFSSWLCLLSPSLSDTVTVLPL